MPNFISTARAENAANRLWCEALPEPLRSRVVKLALHALLADPDNARSATASEVAAGPAWAQQTSHPVHVFKLPLAGLGRLEKLRRQLGVLETGLADSGFARHRSVVHLLARCDRMSFQALQGQLTRIEHAWDDHLEETRAQSAPDLFDHAQLTCDSGLVWVRVRSHAMLNQCGQALRNCCRRGSEMYARYCTAMSLKKGEFWALREASAIVGLAHIDTARWELVEARGYANAALGRAAELESLAASLLPRARHARETRRLAARGTIPMTGLAPHRDCRPARRMTPPTPALHSRPACKAGIDLYGLAPTRCFQGKRRKPGRP